VAPSEISFIDPAAWKDIYQRPRLIGNALDGKDIPELPKPDWFFRPNMSLEPNIISVDFETHARLRRDLAPGFSEKNLREQEALINVYIDRLIKQLRERSGNGTVEVDLAAWIGFATTDIIADLALGESFKLLETGQGNEYSAIFNRVIREDMTLAGLRRVAPQWVTALAYKFIAHSRINYLALCKTALERRVASGIRNRPDLAQPLIDRSNTPEGYPFGSIVHTMALVIFAGEETTAAVLSGCLYYLATNPECFERAQQEVRSRFRSEKEITMNAVNRLEYTIACLNETMRIYPPVAHGLPRITPPRAVAPNGVIIAGNVVPPDTNVSISPYAVNHYPGYWRQPGLFCPERWLVRSLTHATWNTWEAFRNDRTEGLKPFFLGPRDCIGQNLARVEMRLILARFLFAFDKVEVCEQSKAWTKNQRGWVTWAKPELFVRLTPREMPEDEEEDLVEEEEETEDEWDEEAEIARRAALTQEERDAEDSGIVDDATMAHLRKCLLEDFGESPRRRRRGETRTEKQDE